MRHSRSLAQTAHQRTLTPTQATLIALFTRALVGGNDGELDTLFSQLVNDAPPTAPASTHPNIPEPYQVTIAEAARRLSISYRHMCRLIEAGQIPAIGSGRGRRVALADLRGWQDRNRVWEGGK